MPTTPDPPPGLHAAFLRERTRLGSPPLVPEVVLHLGTGVVELWEGVEAQVGRTGLEPPFWAFAWAGGQALARHVLDHPQLVAGRSVLDVASGSGLVAVAAALAGAAPVLASDVDPFAVAALAANAAANRVDVTGTVRDVLDGDGEGADVVLVGDAFYARDMAARVLRMLERAAARGALVLVGDPGRAYLPRERLELLAEHDVPVPADLEGGELRRSTVWALRRPPAGTAGPASP